MLLDRNFYEHQLERSLAGLATEIGRIQAKAGSAEVEARLRYDRVAESLRRIQGTIAQHLREIQAAGEETWEALGTDPGHAQWKVRASREALNKTT